MRSSISLPAVLCSCFMLFSGITNAQFSAGNIVVLQVGDGTSTFTNTGNAIILKEFSHLGTMTFSLAVPFTGTNALLISGSASSEGGLTGGNDPRFLFFGGYAATLPSVTNLPGSTASSVNRAVGMVNAAGGYTRVAVSASFFSTGNIRCATGDAQNFWAGGSSQGTNYFGINSAPATIQNSKANTRCTRIQHGQLYFCTQSAAGINPLTGIYAAGNGTPVISGQVIANVINTGTGSAPESFYFAPGLTPTVCYVADSRSGAGGGVQKWILGSSGWTHAYTIPASSSSQGAFGVVASFSGSVPVVFATSIENTNNRLMMMNDIGAASVFSTIANAGGNASFRGVAFSPCETPTAVVSAAVLTVCAGQAATISASAQGGSSHVFGWAGPASFTAAGQHATVTTPVSGQYTVNVNNGCGVSSAAISLSVIPLPVVTASASAMAVCPGSSVILYGGGAPSYSWSGGISNNVPFYPAVSDVYTVSAEVNGCTGTGSISVTVNTFVVAVPEVVICPGQQATLTATGALTYTWSNAMQGSVIAVSPAASTNYSVSATSQHGCVESFTTAVHVTTTPSVSVNSVTVCAGETATLYASGAATYTWNGVAGNASLVLTPSVSGSFTVTGGLPGCTATGSSVATVQVLPLPVLIISGDSLLCGNSSVTLSVAGGNSYLWSTGETTSLVVTAPSQSTVYTVWGSVNGCSASAAKSVTVDDLPVIIMNHDSTTICAGEEILLVASGGQSWLWENGVTEHSVIIGPLTATAFSVTGFSAAGCSVTASAFVNVTGCDGIGDTELASVCLYPNPCSERVCLSHAAGTVLEIELWHANGKLIGRVPGDTVDIDVSCFQNGLYNLRLVSKSGSRNIRVVKRD